MRIAVLSGKGGTGKTFISVNLAYVAGCSVYIDCDVEEPNGRLFFKGETIDTKEVSVALPEFDREKCVGCRSCVRFCRFNALAFIGNRPKVFKEVCHSCGGCLLVCKKGAVSEKSIPIGKIEMGTYGAIHTVTGELNPGEASGVPVIREALKTGFDMGTETTIIDCPPGSACTVTESIAKADFCIIAAEPTTFGFHNFKMAAELVKLMKKPGGVVINKYDGEFSPLEEYCRDNSLPILGKIEHSIDLARLISEGKIASEENGKIKELFRKLLMDLGGRT